MLQARRRLSVDSTAAQWRRTRLDWIGLRAKSFFRPEQAPVVCRSARLSVSGLQAAAARKMGENRTPLRVLCRALLASAPAESSLLRRGRLSSSSAVSLFPLVKKREKKRFFSWSWSSSSSRSEFECGESGRARLFAGDKISAPKSQLASSGRALGSLPSQATRHSPLATRHSWWLPVLRPLCALQSS